MNLFRSFPNTPAVKPLDATSAKLTLVRAFVQTGDERCPIAGIWSRLPEPAAPADEPESATPIAAVSLPRWAFHLAFNAVRYSIV
jgi:hypothetical protein